MVKYEVKTVREWSNQEQIDADAQIDLATIAPNSRLMDKARGEEQKDEKK